MSITDENVFPIQGDYFRDPKSKKTIEVPRTFVPLWLAEEAFAQYARHYGTDQSLERIAQRGGFGRDEFLDLLAGGRGDGKALRILRERRGGG